MRPSWLRRLFKKRFEGQGATAPAGFRFDCEWLEDRICPADRIWTGGAIAAAGSLGTNSINASWSNDLNWDTGKPQTGDNVIFPGPPFQATLSTSAKPLASIQNGVLVWEINSLVDANFDINNLTINDDHYHIDAFTPQTLTIRGSITSNISKPLAQLSGVSLLGPLAGPSSLTLLLPNNGTFLTANNVGVLEITARLTEGASPVGLTKNGSGTMVLGGPSSLTGTVNVNTGTLIIANNTALGTTANGTVVQDTATLGVAEGNNIQESLDIVGVGNGGVGALAAVARPLLTFGPVPGLQNGVGTWAGGVNMSSDASIGSIGQLNITGVVTSSGTFSLTKVGTGTLSLRNGNTYTGDTFVNVGVLDIQNNNALNNAFGVTVVASNAALSITGNLTVAERLFLNGTGLLDNNGNPRGALRLITAGGVADWTGAVTLLSDTSIAAVSTAFLTISGLFDGTDNLRKTDAGTLRFTNANTGFTGNTTISDGVLVMPNALALGPATASGAGSITVTSGPGPGGGVTSGSLELTGTFSLPKDLFVSGPGFANGGALRIVDAVPNVTGSNITLTPATSFNFGLSTSLLIQGKSSLDIQSVIDSTGGTAASLEKIDAGVNGTGVLYLSNSNPYLGATLLRGGLTVVRTSTSLGGGGVGNNTVVSAGATLQFEGALSIIEDIVISGVGITVGGVNQGALQATTGANTIQGTITLLGTGAVTEADVSVANGASLTFFGSVGGNANLRKIGLGELALAGSTQNTYTSQTFVDAGTLALQKTGGAAAVLGLITVGDGIGGNNADVLRLDGSEQIPTLLQNNNPLVVVVNESGLFNLNGFNETIGGLTLQGGEVMTAGAGGPGLLVLNGNVTVNMPATTQSSLISGRLAFGAADRTFTVADGAAAQDLIVSATVTGLAGLIKAGPGTMQLTGTGNSYTGATTINGGTLQLGVVNALPTTTAVTITAGTLDLQGNATTVGSLVGGGTLALGAGTLTTGGLNTAAVYSGAITGSGGVTKVGTGTLTLSGNSPTYTGTTAVNGGTVFVNGDQGAAAVTVAGGTTLGGTGTVGAVTVQGGTLAPGAAAGLPGTLTAGSVVFQANSAFAVDVTGTGGGQFDQLAVTGNVTLNNTRLALNVGAVNPSATALTILQTGGTVSGSFVRADGSVIADLDTVSANGRILTVDYTGSAVTVTVTGLAAVGTVTTTANPVAPNTNVDLVATFSPDPAISAPSPVNGTVQFFDGATPIGAPQTLSVSGNTGTATLANFQFTTTGVHNITARIVTSGNGYQGTSANLAQTVNYPTVTTIVTSDPQITFGDAVTFTATVFGNATAGAPTGTITFVNGMTGAVLGTVLLSAVSPTASSAALATTGVAAGNNSIVAIYTPAGTTYRSTSAAVAQTVDRAALYAYGASTGGNGLVTAYNQAGTPVFAAQPFGAYPGGTKVAVGDVNNDGVNDLIVLAGPGALNGLVEIFNGRDFSLLGAYFGFFAGYPGELNVAAGDVNGDGTADVILGTATGLDLVLVYDGASPNLMAAYSAFAPFFGPFGFTGGITVAAGDVNGDGRADVIVGAASQLALATVNDGLSGGLMGTFFLGFPIGLTVAAGDTNGDGKDEVILGTRDSLSLVEVYDGSSLQLSAAFLAFPSFPTGANVGATDRDGDGKADIIVGASTFIPFAQIFSGISLSPLDAVFLTQTGNSLGLNVGGA